jgi:hypothetical protein
VADAPMPPGRTGGRPLPDCFAPSYGSVEIGRRGGMLVPGATLSVPLEPR